MSHFSRMSLSFRRALLPLCIVICQPISMFAQSKMDLTGLRADGQSGVAIVSKQPAFTWWVETRERDLAQKAWQILVASSEETLASDKGDLWDSGRQPVTRSPVIVYAGAPLAVGSQYFWKARVWDKKDNASAWSMPARMVVAPTAPADWQGAAWLDDGKKNPERDEDFYKEDPAPRFRKEFKLDKPVARAWLHVAGLGYGIPSLNGKRLGDISLDPPWTAFDKRVLFRSHDVSASLQNGENCLGMTIGNGWHNPLPLRMWGGRNIRLSLPVGRPRFIALLVVEHPDGTKSTITSGPGWRVGTGPTLRNSIYLGEERDARLADEGWDKPGYDDSKWREARATSDSLEPLRPILDMPPVLATEVIPAVAVTSPKEGIHIVDFGKNFTGLPEIRFSLPAGTRVMLRFGELLYPDGTLNPMTSVCGQIKGTRKDKEGKENPIGGPGAPAIAWQQDVFIARGGEGEIYRPDFTFHAFRYMEITGIEKAPALDSIRGLRLESVLPRAGGFSCSDPLLNRIQEVTVNTFRNNVISVASDCPHRERFSYGGDIVPTADAFLMNFDMAGFYANTIRNWSEAARPDGDFTDTAPFVGIQYCGVGWAMVHPLLLESHYRHYGDVRLLKEQFPAAVKWFDLEASKRVDGLVVNGLGDHESIGGKTRGPSVITPMFIDTAHRMARLARIIGKADEAPRFEKMADESAAAWSKAFLDPATGKVGGGSQSEQAMALGFGAAPEATRDAVFQTLVGNLTAQEDGPQLTTGIFGTRFLLDELTERGRPDLAYQLATRKTFPSWGWMIERGATSLWETWKESDNTFSHNHPMFGSISGWFFRHLGGIQPADDAVAFDRIIIRPQVIPDLKAVNSWHQSIRGPIVSNRKAVDKGHEFEIAIPADATATIYLPKGTITESGRAIDGSGGLTLLPAEGNVQPVQVGSGSYRFLVVPELSQKGE
jgi:alpha-L-rhamnosidase